MGVNTDPTESRITVKVKMSYSSIDIRERTSVCLMNLQGTNGLYIYVRHLGVGAPQRSPEFHFVSGSHKFDILRPSGPQHNDAIAEAERIVTVIHPELPHLTAVFLPVYRSR